MLSQSGQRPIINQIHLYSVLILGLVCFWKLNLLLRIFVKMFSTGFNYLKMLVFSMWLCLHLCLFFMCFGGDVCTYSLSMSLVNTLSSLYGPRVRAGDGLLVLMSQPPGRSELSCVYGPVSRGNRSFCWNWSLSFTFPRFINCFGQHWKYIYRSW